MEIFLRFILKLFKSTRISRNFELVVHWLLFPWWEYDFTQKLISFNHWPPEWSHFYLATTPIRRVKEIRKY